MTLLLAVTAISASTTIILVAAIGLFTALTASATTFASLKSTARTNAKARAADAVEAERIRKEEWARQDLVAERVEAASAAAHLAAVDARAQMKQVEATTGVIHRLVNSDKTAAMERSLKSSQSQVLLHKSIIRLNEAAGREASPEDLAAIKQLQTDIGNLQTELAERHRQDEIAEKQIDVAREQGNPVEPV